MQSLYPLVAADFTAKAKQPVSKLEIFIECCAYDLCDFYGKNYLIEAHYSSGERQLSYSPVAAEFTAIIDNTDGLFHPKNTDSPFYSYLKVGRKIIFHTGFKKDGIDYLWQWFEGIISDVQIDTNSHQIIIKGFDYTQYLTEVKLKSPDNYWGSHLDTVTVADQAGYDMPGGCNGVYIAYLDGVQIYAGDYWIYDEGSNKFFFLPSKIPVADDIELVIYYYTTQVPENVIADLLVAADLYPTQAAALANMDYTATGADDDIDRVRFNTGVSVFYAIQKICERVDYEFFFKYDGTPLFKPIATVGASQFTFGKELISSFNYIENIDEVRNHIVIEGEEYSIYDELYRILDGTEIMYTLDDIPDGASYGRMALTSISAGKIIIAGCDAEVTDQMFTTPAARNNVEAWKHASDVTLIDGGKIYTNSIILANVSGDLDDIANGDTYGKVNITNITAGNIVLAQCSGDLDDIAEGTDYGKVLITDISAGHILLSACSGDADDISESATKKWAGVTGADFIKAVDDLDDISNGASYGRVLLADITAGHIVLANCSGDLDDIANGASYGKVALTSISAGKIIVAGLDNDVTARMFADGDTKTDIEAWRHASDVTLIDGGDVYANSLLVNKLTVGGSGNTEDTLDIWQGETDTQILRLRSTSIDHQITQGGGVGYDWGTLTDCFYYARKNDVNLGGVHTASFTEATGAISYQLYAVYGAASTAKNSSASGAINLAGLKADPANHSYQTALANENIFCLKAKPGSFTSDLLTGGTPTVDSVATGSAANIVDDDTGTVWSSADVAFPHWFKYDFGAGNEKVITRFRYMTHNGRVKDFKIQGSNNDSDWVDLYTGQGTNISQVWSDSYDFSNSTAYRYYRIYVTTSWDAGNYCSFYECEMRLWSGTFGAIFIVDEDGDVLYDGAAGAFQNEDDTKLLGELEDILGSKISKEEMKEKDVFKKHKIINVAEVDAEDHGKDGKLIKTGKKRLDRFISTKRLNMLLMGAIRQLNEKIEILEKKIDK